MNILYHHRTRGQGVEGVHIRGMVDALRELGHEVSLLSLPGANPYRDLSRQERGTIAILRALLKKLWNMISFCMPEFLFEILEVFYNFRAVIRLLIKIQSRKIDLIYERYSLNCFAGALAGEICGIPVILEVNDSAFVEERVRRLLIKPLAGFSERIIFKKAGAIITVSARFREIILENTGAAARKIHVLPNACDTELFNPANYNSAGMRRRYRLQDKVVAGYTGSFAYWHGVLSLVEIIGEVTAANEKIHFLFIGKGGGLKDAKQLISKKGLDNRVAFIEGIVHSSVPEYMTMMDMGVIPASNEYGSPMKLFEYMAMGIVPVAPALGPIREVVEDGVSGVLFKPGCREDMKRKILEIAADAEKRRVIGINARDAVVRRHRWIHNASSVLAIARKIT